MRREPGERVSSLDLVTVRSARFWARRQTRAVLRAWQLPPETVETAELLVSELITNAIKGAAQPKDPAVTWPADVERICLTMRLVPGRMIIEVFDNDPNPPLLAHPDPDAEAGRGLMLVDALSKEWSYYSLPSGGKVVYCVIEAEDTHS